MSQARWRHRHALGAACTVCLGLGTALAAPRGERVAVDVDTGADVRAFSPLIFGVAYGDAARNAVVGYPLRRWGGNSTTRYNWRVDVHNAGSDWFFENIPGAADRSQVPPLGNAADAFVGETLAAGTQVLLTIPTIGWTPRADSPQAHPYFAGFSVAKYGAQQQTDPWDPDAGNGVLANGTPITGNDPADTSATAGPAFQRDWIAHLQSAFGTAAAGGVRFYALDNEPMLWNSTHRDVHPAPATYDEIWARAAAYGAAIKQQDPHAAVLGPVTWGYCDLFGSAADTCVDGPDRQAHGGMPFVAWYLQQACTQPLPGGARAVDYLDLHYYPQGFDSSSDDDGAALATRRFAALKELYDPDWVSQSWIADLGGDYARPRLIRRVRAWIDQYCPGTRLALSEYRWSGDGSAGGAVAQAELFGVFAREGVDLATRWIAPVAQSRVERAFTLFLDYDGAGSRVNGSSVRAASADADAIGAYAFVSASRSFVLLTNRGTSAQGAQVRFARPLAAAWTLYGFDAAQPVHALASGTLGGDSLVLDDLPPTSANLLVIESGDGIFADAFEAAQ
ncbi:glycoside hydrolase family 44 protein [Dokdonella ginsengisoli]|uniref:Glycoside hydrolase family 44 protein n=1 Tax=Dokdonella ginsengisoli TaxID=363846 RepID=A0ABV9QRQ0_9GAMM